MKKDILIAPEADLKEALKKLDKTAEKTLFVVDSKNRLMGSLTDGDVRRYILKTGKLEGKVIEFCNRSPFYVRENKLNKRRLKKIFLDKKFEVVPIINDLNEFVSYITWTEILLKEQKEVLENKKIDIPVVIMAGGKGTRLSPFTEVLPKPLIPIGGKTVVEMIIDKFKSFGINKFYLTLNYKGELIKAYFDGIKKDYDIHFIWEKKFLGTAGSLSFLKDKIKGNFIVSNCDILINADFSKVLEFHKNSSSIFTSITSIQRYKIPYGVVNIKHGGLISEIIEKPEYVFQINTGIYVLSSESFSYIPESEYYDMPELIKKLMDNNKKVFAYPVNESDYIDVGQWEEYKKAVGKLQGELLNV